MEIKSVLIICLLSITLSSAQDKLAKDPSKGANTILDENCPSLDKRCTCKKTGHSYDMTCTSIEQEKVPEMSANTSKQLDKLDLGVKSKIKIIQNYAFLNISTTILSLNDLMIGSIQPLAFSGMRDVLRYLYLENNKLTSIPDGVFSELTSLLHLSLSNNQLYSLPPQLLTGLKSLRYLELYGNRLTTVPTAILREAPALKSISLHHNDISQLTREVFYGLTDLREITLNENSLTILPVEIFAQNPKLERLIFDGNQLNELSPNMFRYTPVLKHLSMRSMGLRVLPKDLFVGLEYMEYLDISNNTIVNLAEYIDFTHLKDLKYFYAVNNGIKSLSDNMFSPLVNLKILHLYDNAISRLPAKVFDGLVKLTDLNLGGNRLEVIPDDLFKTLVNLTSLYLDRNLLTTLSGKMSEGIGNLQQLNLAHNLLNTMPKEAIKNLPSLQTIDLSYNAIKKITGGLTTGAVYLSLDHNMIESIEERAFESATQLQNLDLSYNSISTLTTDMFSGLGKLYNLRLTGNKLEAIPARSLLNLHELRRLFIDGNNLKSIGSASLDEMRLLEEVDFSHNQITSIEGMAFQYQKRLRFLRISDNSLKQIHEDAFRNLDAIEDLDLDRNDLTRVTETQLRFLKTLKTLNVTDNPWECGCNMGWLRAWDVLEEREKLVCSSPKHMAGYLLTCFPVEGCGLNISTNVSKECAVNLHLAADAVEPKANKSGIPYQNQRTLGQIKPGNDGAYLDNPHFNKIIIPYSSIFNASGRLLSIRLNIIEGKQFQMHLWHHQGTYNYQTSRTWIIGNTDPDVTIKIPDNECILVREGDGVGFMSDEAKTPVTYEEIVQTGADTFYFAFWGQESGSPDNVTFIPLNKPWKFDIQVTFIEGVMTCQ